MKLVIVEGLDNTGKTTVIQELVDYYKSLNLRVIHCEKPVPDTPENMAKAQNSAYINLADEIVGYKGQYDIVIVDRCWYSEFVYGQIYRERKYTDVLDNIYTVEQTLIINIGVLDICLILLNVDDPVFSVKHEDGLSISKANIDKIVLEKQKFEEVFDKSMLINKLNLIVNNGLNFKSKDTIFSKIIKLIEKI